MMLRRHYQKADKPEEKKEAPKKPVKKPAPKKTKE